MMDMQELQLLKLKFFLTRRKQNQGLENNGKKKMLNLSALLVELAAHMRTTSRRQPGVAAADCMQEPTMM
jgi:hypothetical protein